MKKVFIVFILFFACLATFSQAIKVSEMFNMLTLSNVKAENLIKKSGFIYSGLKLSTDTSTKVYRHLNNEINTSEIPLDSEVRFLHKSTFRNNFNLTYQTSLLTEIISLKNELKRGGFKCVVANDSLQMVNQFYQHLNMTVDYSTTYEDSTLLYQLVFQKKKFPDANDLFYADDLLFFTSHEYLVFFFGEENVKKDIYYFSGNEISKCTVLFSGTKRQVVFIWEDEENKREISNLLIGGQQKLKSLMDKDKYVPTSSWLLKSGLYAGMSLIELRNLNENDFNFYAGNAINSGLVMEDTTGKLDFLRENVILSCINCRDNLYASTAIMSADKAIKDDRILFVLSVVLNPTTFSARKKN